MYIHTWAFMPGVNAASCNVVWRRLFSKNISGIILTNFKPMLYDKLKWEIKCPFVLDHLIPISGISRVLEYRIRYSTEYSEAAVKRSIRTALLARSRLPGAVNLRVLVFSLVVSSGWSRPLKLSDR